jgi:hypothetical protein
MNSKDKMEFAFLMAKHSDARLADLQRLLRLASGYKRVFVDSCNGPDYSRCKNDAQRLAVSCYWQSHQEKLPARKEKLHCKIEALLETFGCTLHISSGGNVFAVVPDGYTNNMGRDGIWVPA